MAHERTWEETHRDVNKCRDILLRNDAITLERRALRLSKISSITTFVWKFQIPQWTGDLLDEAECCYLDGNFTGSIVCLAAGTEHALRELCRGKVSDGLGELIKLAASKDRLNGSEIELLKSLNQYRNKLAHSDIDELSNGLKIQRGWVATDPENESEKQILIRFAMESNVENLLFPVRDALHDVFDRAKWKSNAPDDEL